MNYFLLELFLGIGVMLLPFLGVVIWRKMPVFHGIGVILLGIYLGMVWNITGLPTIQTFHLEVQGGVSMIPFQDFSAFGCIANVIMVMPLGFLLPLLWENYRKLWKTALAGFSLSLCIEILQLFTFRATDVDDLLMNTLGGIRWVELPAMGATFWQSVCSPAGKTSGAEGSAGSRKNRKLSWHFCLWRLYGLLFILLFTVVFLHYYCRL